MSCDINVVKVRLELSRLHSVLNVQQNIVSGNVVNPQYYYPPLPAPPSMMPPQPGRLPPATGHIQYPTSEPVQYHHRATAPPMQTPYYPSSVLTSSTTANVGYFPSPTTTT